jgi:hypothetical protein
MQVHGVAGDKADPWNVSERYLDLPQDRLG